MTVAEQRDVVERARDAGRWLPWEMSRSWERAHGQHRREKRPPQPVLDWACSVMREVEEFLGERVEDRLEMFARLINGYGYTDEKERRFWWIAGYVEDLTRAFEEMP